MIVNKLGWELKMKPIFENYISVGKGANDESGVILCGSVGVLK